jgi:hypothetical protein
MRAALAATQLPIGLYAVAEDQHDGERKVERER